MHNRHIGNSNNITTHLNSISILLSSILPNSTGSWVHGSRDNLYNKDKTDNHNSMGNTIYSIHCIHSMSFGEVCSPAASFVDFPNTSFILIHCKGKLGAVRVRFSSSLQIINIMGQITRMISWLAVVGLLAEGGFSYSKKQINAKIDETSIMYGSTLRIKAAAFSYHLHSHLVNYPLGSGQQSVTGMPADNDYNSLWTLKEPNNQPVKTYQEQVKCGDSVRLEHALTKKNLHSEEIYQSMVTKNQEVSCYGTEGQGDDNDNWILKCVSKGEGESFAGGDLFELIHENTDKKLKMSKFYEYSFQNWENCPFQGQLEVSATDRSTKETQFKIMGGIFFKDAPTSPEQEETLDGDL